MKVSTLMSVMPQLAPYSNYTIDWADFSAEDQGVKIVVDEKTETLYIVGDTQNSVVAKDNNAAPVKGLEAFLKMSQNTSDWEIEESVNEFIDRVFLEFTGHRSASDAYDCGYRISMSSDGDGSSSWEDSSDAKDSIERDVRKRLGDHQFDKNKKSISDSKELHKLYAVAVANGVSASNMSSFWARLQDDSSFWEIAFSRFTRYDG